MHSTVAVQSFTQDRGGLLGKEGSQGKGVPAIPGFNGEINQEENQESLLRDWPLLKNGLMMFNRAGQPH